MLKTLFTPFKFVSFIQTARNKIIVHFYGNVIEHFSLSYGSISVVRYHSEHTTNVFQLTCHCIFSLFVF
jgi:hypothetical protein